MIDNIIHNLKALMIAVVLLTLMSVFFAGFVVGRLYFMGML